MPAQHQVHVLAGHAGGAQRALRRTVLQDLAELQHRRRRRAGRGEGHGAVGVLCGPLLCRGARLLLCEVYAGGDLLQRHRNGHQTAETQLQLQGGAHVHQRRGRTEAQLLQTSEGAHAQSHTRVCQSTETRLMQSV